jgi:hypothetical protein
MIHGHTLKGAPAPVLADMAILTLACCRERDATGNLGERRSIQ